MKETILLLTGFIALNFQGQAQTVKDIDDNVYNTVMIGTQIWMKENLRVTKYNDSTEIPLVTSNTAWASLTTPAYCSYNNSTNADTINSYGRLYNYYAVNTNKLCPTGWHVPGDGEWTTLTTYLGGESIAGTKLKETGTAHWQSPNNATNESGFTALPGGFRNVIGSFNGIGVDGYWWSSTDYLKTNAYFRSMSFYYSDVTRSYGFNKSVGAAVRCVKDSLSTKVKDVNYNTHTKIYPNPAIDGLTIECSDKGSKLSIYNIVGELVIQKDLINSKNEIDISNLQNGMYVIITESVKGSIQQKLIKTKN